MNKELKLQLALLDIKFNPEEINLDKINWREFFISASNNRILYHVSNETVKRNLVIDDYAENKIKEILSEGKNYIKQTQKSLEYLNNVLPKIKKEFLVCKTQKIFNYVTFDIDCLFKPEDYKEVLTYLNNLGGKRIECKKKLQEDIIIEGMIRMDMHDGFHWHGSNFINNERVWSAPEKKTIFGIDNYLAPNITMEWTLTMLNLIYERHYVPLLDYHYLLNIHNKIDWGEIFKIAKEYNWENGLMVLLNKFNQIHYFLFDEILIDISRYHKNYQFKPIKNLRIPFIFSYFEGSKIFYERITKKKIFSLVRNFIFFLCQG